MPILIGIPMPGSIPACAGEPFRANCIIRRGRVYPRVCGGTDGGQHACRP